MSRKISVMVVDDSAYARTNLSRRLSEDDEIEIVGWASDGEEAVKKAKELKPDVITMDIVMPKMDGLDALELIMKDCPTPVLMVSALTREGANITIRALELGAVDFVLKPGRNTELAVGDTADDICAKVKMAAAATVKRAGASGPAKPVEVVSSGRDIAVVIGVSTGGPQALSEVLPSFPASTEAAILVVQHMPAGFTRSLAERLNASAKLPVEEAHAGSAVEPGKILIAPGGFHMTINRSRRVELNDGPAECGVRPSVNVTMESVVDVYGGDTIGVVLTGMGSDGTRGAGLIKAAGGRIVAQDESTCVVYGMPKSVAEAGYVDRVVKLNRVAAEVGRTTRRQVVTV